MASCPLNQFESWLDTIKGEWATQSHASLRTGLEMETGLQDYAVVVMATGIIGFGEDKTPIIENHLIHPTMQQLFQESKALQGFVKNALCETFGERGGWSEKRGEELADKGMEAVLLPCAKPSWQTYVRQNQAANGMVRA